MARSAPLHNIGKAGALDRLLRKPEPLSSAEVKQHAGDGLAAIEKVVEAIHEGCGTRFDPDVVDGFLAVHMQLSEVARKYGDDGNGGR